MAIHRDTNRCARCRSIPQACICEGIPAIEVPYRMVVYQHPVEHWRQTNSGRLISLGVVGADLIHAFEAADEARLDAMMAEPGVWPVMVFPDQDALTVDQLKADDRWISGARPLFLVPDGSWRQCRKMCRKLMRRFPAIRAVTLHPTRSSRYRLRRQVHAEGLCTAEAAALLMEEIGEGEWPWDTMARFLEYHVSRQLSLKGYTLIGPDGYALPSNDPRGRKQEPDPTE